MKAAILALALGADALIAPAAPMRANVVPQAATLEVRFASSARVPRAVRVGDLKLHLRRGVRRPAAGRVRFGGGVGGGARCTSSSRFPRVGGPGDD